MAIHCILSGIMGQKRIKQAELAEMTGISKSTIFKMYHDKLTKINYDVLDRICDVLECDITDIIVYEPNQK